MIKNILFVSLTLLISGQANAATVYSQTSPVITAGIFSDVDASQYIADDFTLGGLENIRSVGWTGVYLSADTPPINDMFTINFYADSGGSVGSLITSFNVGNAVIRTDTGQDNFGSDIYGYIADLSSDFTATAGTKYWMSIFNDTTSDTDDQWAWLNSLTLGGSFRFSGISPNGPWRSGPGGMFYSLDNTRVVPVPAAVWLFGTALVVLGGFSRRRKAA